MIAALRERLALIANLYSAIRKGARSRLVEAAGPILRAALALTYELHAAWAARGGERRLRRLNGAPALRVHLGSGGDVRAGWVNIDLSTTNTGAVHSSTSNGRTTVYVNYDLRRGLPLPDGSCEIIYSSHFFEHLDRRDGYRLMIDAHRALRSGGVFRVVIPDFRACFEAYVRNDADYFKLIDLNAVYPGPAAKPLSIVDNLNYAVYQFGEHRCIYDEEKLGVLLTGVGFRSVERVAFDASVDVDAPLRRQYSLYIEATK